MVARPPANFAATDTLTSCTDAAAVPRQPVRKKIDVALAVSILALLVAGWAANETREARLDTRRMQLRTEALAFVQDVRVVANTFSCYGQVKGAKLDGQTEFMQALAGQEKTMRSFISQLNNWGTDALTKFEENLNSVKGQPQSMLYVVLATVRNAWDKELREKADAICKAS